MIFDMKMFIRQACVLCLLFSSVQCSDFKTNPEASNIKSSLSIPSSCIKRFSVITNLYLSQSLEPDDLDQFWFCFQKRVKSLRKYMRGRDGDSYSRQQLESFFLRFFKFQGGNGFWDSIMLVKSVFLSAQWESEDLTRLKRTEVDRLSELFKLLKVITKELNPHLHVLLEYHKKEGRIASSSERGEAILALRKSLIQLGQWMDENSHPLDMSQLRKFVESIEGNIGGRDVDLSSWVDILDRGQTLLMGPLDDSSPGHQSWVSLLERGSKLFEIYNYNDFFVTRQNITKGEGFTQLRIASQRVQTLLSEALLERPEQAIPNSEVHDFIESMKSAGLVTGSNADLLKSTWDLLMDKILKAKEFQGEGFFHISHLQTFQEEFNDWVNTQVWIESDGVIEDNLSCNGPMVKEEKELVRLAICSPWPLRKAPLGFTLISSDLLDENWNQDDLSSLNWKRSLVRQVVRVYSLDPNSNILSGLNFEEVGDAFEDLSPIIESLLNARYESQIYKQIFSFSDLLTPMADGNLKMGLGEAVSYMDYLLSSFRLADFVIANSSHCTVPFQRLPRSYTNGLYFDCYWKNFKANSLALIPSMPNLSHYLSYLSEDEWSELKKMYGITLSTESLSNFLDPVVKVFESSPRRLVISRGELAVKLVSFSLLEVTMLKYDQNKDGLLNIDETLDLVSTLVPTFFPKFSRLNIFSSKEELRSYLIFSIKYGEFLYLTTMSDIWFVKLNAWWEDWQKGIEPGELTLDRKQLLKALLVFQKIK